MRWWSGVVAVVVIAAGCGAAQRGAGSGTDAGTGTGTDAGTGTETETELRGRVVAEFEQAVLASREAYQALFDFGAVGKFEILLHRYDALGRLPLSDESKAALLAEDGTPYPPERERRNLGNFYPILAQRTVGRGGCQATEPVDEYARLLGVAFEPLPAGHEAYESLRREMNALLAVGGVVGIRCDGGSGALAVVYTRTTTTRGYDLITLYDDEGVPAE